MSNETREPTDSSSANTRAVAAGDVLSHLSKRFAEQERVERRSTATEIVREQVVADLVHESATSGDAAQLVRDVQAIFAGASPGERKQLKKILLTGPDDAVDESERDAELAPGWRDGAYPYQAPLVATPI